MLKRDILKIIEDTGVVAVVRLNDPAKLDDIVKAISRGGVKAIEITFTSTNALEMISTLSAAADDEILVGAGTVLDADTAKAAIEAGAKFVVSPVLNVGIIETVRKYEKVCVCGAFSPTEILTAWENGADIVKIFPATSVGPQYLKDIHGPLPDIKLSPTGGVTADNAEEFIRSGACFIGVGTALLDKKMIIDNDWGGLTELAGKFIQAVAAGRA